jgi:hypothetical protein
MRKLPPVGGFPAKPIYSVEGSFLWLDLYSDPCDYDDHIRGALRGDTFEGDRTLGGPMGSKPVGTVKGWRVRRNNT